MNKIDTQQRNNNNNVRYLICCCRRADDAMMNTCIFMYWHSRQHPAALPENSVAVISRLDKETVIMSLHKTSAISRNQKIRSEASEILAKTAAFKSASIKETYPHLNFQMDLVETG